MLLFWLSRFGCCFSCHIYAFNNNNGGKSEFQKQKARSRCLLQIKVTNNIITKLQLLKGRSKHKGLKISKHLSYWPVTSQKVDGGRKKKESIFKQIRSHQNPAATEYFKLWKLNYHIFKHFLKFFSLSKN